VLTRYHWEALRRPASVSLLGGAALAGVTLFGVGLAATLGPALSAGLVGGLLLAEGIYLLARPRSASFRRWVDGRRLRGGQDLRVILGRLPGSQLQMVMGLQGLRGHISQNYGRIQAGRMMRSRALGQIDQLIEQFVHLLLQLNACRDQLGAGARSAARQELRQVEAELAGGGAEAVRKIQERRRDLLQQRIDRMVEAETHREVLSHQLAAIEDLVHLMHARSVTLVAPAELASQLEALEIESREIDDTVREVDRFLSFERDMKRLMSSAQGVTR